MTHNNCAPPPNGLGVWRALAAGEVHNVLCPIHELAAALKISLGTDNITMTLLKEQLQGITPDKLASMNITIHYHKGVPGDLLWVPTGWMHCELSTTVALIYGVRKTMLAKHEQASANYESIIESMVAEKTDVTNYQSVLPFLQVEMEEER